MQPVIQILVGLVSLFISILELLILLRALSSWFPMEEDSPVMNFLYFTTEPLLAPIRALLDRSAFFQSLPIDASSMVAMLLLLLISLLLPEVHF